MDNLIKTLLLFTAIIASVLIIIKFNDLSFTIYSNEQFDRSFSQVATINPVDEYIIAEQINGETFNKTEFTRLFDNYPIGDSEATLSLVATYKYYIRLSELTHELADRTLTLRVPKLYLSTPVAFSSTSVTESGQSRYLGRDPKALLTELRAGVSPALESKGRAQINNVRDKAAQSLADNINSYLTNNGLSNYYDEIIVRFEDDNRNAFPRFMFRDGFCGGVPCSFEFEYAEGKTLVIE